MSTWSPSYSTNAAARNRLSCGSFDRQTVHWHPMIGTPCEVPPSLRDPSHRKRRAPPSYVAEGGHRFSDKHPLSYITMFSKVFTSAGS